MIKKIKHFAQKIGIDGAIFYNVLARVIQAGGGVISIFFIASYLTKVEQGYYYTFGSILAIQIFFELGLSNIITQFVAHEKAHLHWEDKTKLVGDEKSLSRLASLLRFCVKWFAIIALILIVTLLISGYLFFTKYGKVDNGVEWQIPWIILSIITAANLVVSPILAFLEGLGKVKEVAKIRLFQQISQMIGMLSFLMLGLKLFSSPLAATIAAIIPPLWLFRSYKKQLLKNIWNEFGEWKVNYKLEIFPYQWRIALSWISGYFIFQLFNPVLFATEGSIVAGQMGMTLTVLSGILSISMSWINTKIPLFSNLIAKKDFNNLDLTFNRTLKQACFISAIGLLSLVFTVLLLHYYKISLANRFLPLFSLILLCICTFVNQIVSGFAIYLRCHMKEPYLVLSIVMGISSAFSTIILGKYFGVDGIVVGYSFLTVFVSLIWGTLIFRKNKKLWHQ